MMLETIGVVVLTLIIFWSGYWIGYKTSQINSQNQDKIQQKQEEDLK